MSKSPRTIPVAEFIKTQIRQSGRTQTEIAKEIGYPPNMLAMISNGASRLPLNKVPALASSLGVDPLLLLRMAMTEYEPLLWNVLATTFQGRLLTANEVRMVEAIREGANLPEDVDLNFTDSELKSISAIASKAAERTIKAHKDSVQDAATMVVRGKKSDKTQRIERR